MTTSGTGPTEPPWALSRRPSGGLGFTLLEISIVLAILVILIGVAVPYMGGFFKEEAIRASARELEIYAKTARLRSMQEQVPWRIRFYHDRFELGPVRDRAANGLGEPGGEVAVETDTGPFRTYTLPSGLVCEVLPWRGRGWQEVKEENAWIFQPTGVCEPLHVRFRKDNSWMQIGFHPLTAEVNEEEYEFR